MAARLGVEGLVKAGQKGGAGPVIHHAIAGIHMVKVGAHHDDRVGIAGEGADQVGLLQPFHWLLGQIAPLASRGFKHGLQRGFPLVVVAVVALESLLDHFPL
jgi:hypothetical protein